jgi:hypothetical protein
LQAHGAAGSFSIDFTIMPDGESAIPLTWIAWSSFAHAGDYLKTGLDCY